MLAIQKYSVTGAIDASFWLYRQHFRVLFSISLLVNVLPMVTNLAAAWAQHQMQTQVGGGVDFGSFATFAPALGLWLGLLGLSSMVTFVCSMFGVAAATHVASRAALGETPDLQQAIDAARRFFWPVLGATLLTSMAMMLGFLFFVVPGIIIMVGFSFVAPVLVLEQRRVTEALDRSWQLTSGRRWKIFGTLLIVTMMIGMVAGTLTVAIALAESMQTSLLGQIAQTLLAQAVSAVATPLWWVAMVLLYYDSRVEKEAFDVEMLARSAAPQA